jgi:hypothetical protein
LRTLQRTGKGCSGNLRKCDFIGKLPGLSGRHGRNSCTETGLKNAHFGARGRFSLFVDAKGERTHHRLGAPMRSIRARWRASVRLRGRVALPISKNLRCAVSLLVKGSVLAVKVKTRLRFQNFGYRQSNKKRSQKWVKNRVFIGVFECFLVSREDDGGWGNAISISLVFGRTFGLRGPEI